jgi:hypothetical protein
MTQDESILHALKFGRRLTPIAALHLYGCFRLAARIYELRQRGHRIERGSRSVRGKWFAEYWMP